MKLPLEVKNLTDPRLTRLAEKMVRSKDFSNGRDIKTWAERIKATAANTYRKGGKMPTKSTLNNAETALNFFLESRKVSKGQSCSSVSTSISDRTATMGQYAPVVCAPPEQRQNIKTVINQPDALPALSASIESETEVESEKRYKSIDDRVLLSLQNFIDSKGLDSKEGVQKLANLKPGDLEFEQLVKQLCNEINGMDRNTATNNLRKWQSESKEVEKMIQKLKKSTREAIWRCRVCKRADKPYIVCWVAPYIVHYQEKKEI